jgi:transposase-like protein
MVELPRDRDASFEPQVVPKHARSFDGFDDQILALYAGGMSTRDIQRHLRELYGVEVSEGLISEVTASIQDDVRAWQSRPLEELYAVVYLDALQVSIRDQQVVRKKAVYLAVGVTMDGERDCLGIWIDKSEGSRFWTSVLTELRNRGVKDILFVCTDGLSGFPEAIDAVFPFSVNQTCVVHLVRQSLRYLSWKERKSFAGELRRIYTAPDADAARAVLDELTAAWADSKTRTAALQVWERAWERVIPFLAFPEEIRRIVYTTNAVESLHMQIRKTIKTRGHFPNDDAALRLIWLSIQRAKTSWRTCVNWTIAQAVIRIHFGDRIPDNT